MPVLTSDYISNVYTRDRKMQVRGENVSQIIVEIVLKSREKHFIQYSFQNDREMSWHAASRDSEVYFESSGLCYINEPEIGGIQLQSKEVRLAYHLDKDNRDRLNQ